MTVPPSVQARTVVCLNFAGGQRGQQLAYVADPGNRYAQFMHNEEDGPSNSKLIRYRPAIDPDTGLPYDEGYLADGPDDVKFRGGAAKPANCKYEYGCYEAAGGSGHFIIFGTIDAPSGDWWEMQVGWDSGGTETAYDWEILDPQPVVPEEWAKEIPFRGSMT
ncbi:MAG: hypothetical protein DRH30_00960 [Deltaproteobacteria bacterium]|nr:MAG: hypothetical protein DRH30_00960 [Deltaproteobacteria bacterium]